jgi:hypothetical protein
MFVQSIAPRRHIDDDIFDEHGVIRDGKRLRVSMADAKPLPLQRMGTVPPLNITTGLEGEFALNNFFYAVDGSPKGPRRRKVVARDPMGREAAEYIEEDAALFADHRPGFRTTVTAADHARVAESYNQMVTDLQNAWRGEPEPQQTADAQRTDDAGRPAGVSDADWAREQNRREIADAWKPRDATDPRESTQKPQGVWPFGGVPVGLTAAKAGDICSADGGRGRLVLLSQNAAGDRS